jgi:hypothetical protein
MSTTRLDTSGIFQGLKLSSASAELSLVTSDVRLRPNGIEFRSNEALALWTEMSVELGAGTTAGRVSCTGVVVSCSGNRHFCYSVSIVFMNLCPQTQQHLDLLVMRQVL